MERRNGLLDVWSAIFSGNLLVHDTRRTGSLIPDSAVIANNDWRILHINGGDHYLSLFQNSMENQQCWGREVVTMGGRAWYASAQISGYLHACFKEALRGEILNQLFEWNDCSALALLLNLFNLD